MICKSQKHFQTNRNSQKNLACISNLFRVNVMKFETEIYQSCENRNHSFLLQNIGFFGNSEG